MLVRVEPDTGRLGDEKLLLNMLFKCGFHHTGPKRIAVLEILSPLSTPTHYLTNQSTTLIWKNGQIGRTEVLQDWVSEKCRLP